MKYYFKNKWDENTDISWWKTSRIELNKIIEHFNNWQKDDNFDVEKSKLLLANIEYGKQTIGSQDGGSGYLEELLDMENFVNKIIN